MLTAGITGGIGSGKSAVCKIFECLGIPVFKADDVGKQLLSSDAVIKQQVVNLLGNSVINNGAINRKAVANIVFNNPHKLAQLNALIHPAVRDVFKKWLIAQDGNITIEEAAILFESGAYKNLDVIIVVTAPEKLRMERVMIRDNVTEKEVRSRIKQQWSEREKVAKADFIIKNDGKNMLIPQVLSIYKNLTQKEYAPKKLIL